MIARDFTDDQVRDALREAVAAAGGVSAWGEAHRYSGRHVRAVLAGQRPIPAGFYPALGFQRIIVTVWRRAS